MPSLLIRTNNPKLQLATPPIGTVSTEISGLVAMTYLSNSYGFKYVPTYLKDYKTTKHKCGNNCIIMYLIR